MRHGVHFDLRHAHERGHLAPLRRRLPAQLAGKPEVASVEVMPDTRPPVRGAWNIQVFHGLGDKGYTGNPIFLQKGRWPRLRTAANMVARSLRLPGPFLRPPERPGRRPSVYEQVNAYGPRFKDRFEDMLDDVVISTFGHIALNEQARFRVDPDGPLLWMPTWDNRRYLGGPNQSSLGPFAHEVALASRHVPVRVKLHPLSLRHDQDVAARTELERAEGVDLVPADADPYGLLDGCRGLLTDSSSLGFEAYCMGVPVAIAIPNGVRPRGLHAELAERTHVLHSGKPDLLGWAEAPRYPGDKAWARDLLYAPSPSQNDAFAADVRRLVAERRPT